MLARLKSGQVLAATASDGTDNGPMAGVIEGAPSSQVGQIETGQLPSNVADLYLVLNE